MTQPNPTPSNSDPEETSIEMLHTTFYESIFEKHSTPIIFPGTEFRNGENPGNSPTPNDVDESIHPIYMKHSDELSVHHYLSIFLRKNKISCTSYPLSKHLSHG